MGGVDSSFYGRSTQVSKKQQQNLIGIMTVSMGMRELEKDYDVAVRVVIEPDPQSVSGRFAIASFEARPVAAGPMGRPVATYRLQLPSSLAASTDALLLRGVMSLATLLDAYFDSLVQA